MSDSSAQTDRQPQPIKSARLHPTGEPLRLRQENTAMKDEINMELGKVLLALGYDNWPLIRRIAACVATRYMWEVHEYGRIEGSWPHLVKLSKRFRLGTYMECAGQWLRL
jgi:hypothetical protein